jgi:hypothetical protein
VAVAPTSTAAKASSTDAVTAAQVRAAEWTRAAAVPVLETGIPGAGVW